MGIPVSLVKLKCKEKDFELISIEGLENFFDWTMIKAKTPIVCNCKKHGDFKTTYDYLKSGRGCPQCGHEIVG